MLHTFVSGFSRFSPRSGWAEPGARLLQADQVQNIYLAGLKLKFPRSVTDRLAWLSKVWLDHKSTEPAAQSDLFLFYSGSGWRTMSEVRDRGVKCVVEAVNSHLSVQRSILQEEYGRLGLPLTGFPPREVERRLAEYELADAILCPSEFVLRSFLAQGIPSSRLLKVPYGFDQIAVSARHERPSDVFRVLYVGQVSVRKGLRYLLAAFAKLRHPRKELWVVGPLTKETGIDDISIPEQTQFLGPLKGESLAAAYQSASVFVLPSLEEGLGLVMGEALSFGLPILASDHSGAHDLFTDEVEGFYCPIRDVAFLTQKLQLLADDPARLAAMSAAAFTRSAALGGWSRASERLIDALQTVLTIPTRRSA